MPKITLLNTSTGLPQDFEPVDAREILSQKDSIYKVPKGATDLIGVPMDSSSNNGINIPQMQGDAEMNTGNSADKYARQAIVKAVPGFASDTPPVSGAKPAMTTAGKVIDDSEDDTTKMKVIELKASLDQKGIAYPATAKKADLQALLDAAP